MRAILLACALLAGCSDTVAPNGTTSSGGGGGIATSGPTSASVSTGTGSGGEAEWTTVPWWPGPCGFEYAKKPEFGFPALKWVDCFAKEPGCQRLDKNWPHDSPSGLASPAVQRESVGAYEIAIAASFPDFEKRTVFFDAEGAPRAVYRSLPNAECLGVQPGLADDGHWTGQQELENPSKFVFQPDGLPASSATVIETDSLSSYQRSRKQLFSLKRTGGSAIEIYDRVSGQLSVRPATLVGAQIPHLVDDAAFFLGLAAFNEPEAWVWSRARGAFEKLIDNPPNHVIDINSDGETLVWLEAPPKQSRGDWPAGTLYTSPYTTLAANVVATPRRAMAKIPAGAPSAMGSGHYAVYSADTNLMYIVRTSDAYQWTLPVPVDEWDAPLNDVTYIDDEYLFYKTGSNVYRQRLDALGPGEPPP